MRLPDEMELSSFYSRSLADVICNNSSDPSDTLLSKLSSRVILSPTDASVGEVNSYLLSRFPGGPIRFKSVDTVVNEEAVSFPDEYLKLVYISSPPPSQANLKG